MRSRLLSMYIEKRSGRAITADTARHGLNFIKLDGDIGCLGKLNDSMFILVR